jgi:hypothetical protein
LVSELENVSCDAKTEFNTTVGKYKYIYMLSSSGVLCCCCVRYYRLYQEA